MKFLPWLNGLLALLGLWLIVAPYILEFSQNTIAVLNNLVVGIIVAVVGFALAYYEKKHLPTQTS